jgi:hypothetical protein
MQYTHIFKTLSQIDVNSRLKEKNGFSYLPWADAEQFAYNAVDPELIKVETFETTQGLVILPAPGDGFMVKVAVTIAGVARGDWYPVIDYDNHVLKNPNAFDINTALQRAKVKAFAQHGLGLYVFLGKDGPDEVNPNDGNSIPDVPPKKEAPAKPVVKAPSQPVTKASAQPASEPEEEAPFDADESTGYFDFRKEEINDAYKAEFSNKIDTFTTVQSMMAWVQSIIPKLPKEKQTQFRAELQGIVAAKATALARS